MHVDVLCARSDGRVTRVDTIPDAAPTDGWVWIDVTLGEVTDPSEPTAPDQPGDDRAALADLCAHFDLDPIGFRDALIDRDHPKVDDFGDHLLIVLHGLRDDRVETYEVDCFLTRDHLITMHIGTSPTIDALTARLVERPDAARGGADVLAARLADVLTRRLLAVLDAFDDRVEELTDKALSADPDLLEDLTAVRTDLARVRRVVHPQREAIDELRHSDSSVITNLGRRHFSDVFDVAERTAAGLDAARAALAETLDAYRGAEARQATEVSKVLTVYAAIMLPLSLIAGFFGMNFDNLPLIESRWGWWIVTAVMIVIALVSLGVFVSLGWIRRASGRHTGRTLGRGLIEASRAPVQLVGAVYEMSAMPIRATGNRLVKKDDASGVDDIDR